MRYFLCSNSVRVMLLKVWQNNRRDMSLQRNCVAVMLLKARGWRGTSLPRGVVTCDFQTRYGFCFFQLHSRYEKAEPVPGSFHAFI